MSFRSTQKSIFVRWSEFEFTCSFWGWIKIISIITKTWNKWGSTFGTTKYRTNDIPEFQNFGYEDNERWAIRFFIFEFLFLFFYLLVIRTLEIHDNFSHWKFVEFRYFSKLSKFKKLLIFKIVKFGKLVYFSNLKFFECRKLEIYENFRIL